MNEYNRFFQFLEKTFLYLFIVAVTCNILLIPTALESFGFLILVLTIPLTLVLLTYYFFFRRIKYRQFDELAILSKLFYILSYFVLLLMTYLLQEFVGEVFNIWILINPLDYLLAILGLGGYGLMVGICTLIVVVTSIWLGRNGDELVRKFFTMNASRKVFVVVGILLIMESISGVYVYLLF
jgi:hypothetical protein